MKPSCVTVYRKVCIYIYIYIYLYFHANILIQVCIRLCGFTNRQVSKELRLAQERLTKIWNEANALCKPGCLCSARVIVIVIVCVCVCVCVWVCGVLRLRTAPACAGRWVDCHFLLRVTVRFTGQLLCRIWVVTFRGPWFSRL